jgi:branched-chain amino acid transport system permease protein
MSEDHTEPTESLRDRLDPGAVPYRYYAGALGLLALALAPQWAYGLVGAGSPVDALRLFEGQQDLLFLRDLTVALFVGMFAMSWDVVSGYTGQISFGHSAFFAAGGYTTALLNLEWGIAPPLAIVGGVAAATLLGLLIGVPALRLEGPYLSLVTLVAPLIMTSVFVYRSDVFGGELGIPSPAPLVESGGFAAETQASYYIALGLFVAILAVLLAVTRSDAGSVFTAIREDEQAVAASGLNPAKFKIFAFVLSAAVGGLAGAVFVHTVGKPSPSQLLVLTVSIEVIIASVIGGMGTIVGAALGGIFLQMFRAYLSGVEATVPAVGLQVGNFDLVIFSVGTLVLLFVLPGGFLRWAIVAGGRLVGDGEPTVAADGGRTPTAQVLATYREAVRRLRGGRRE